MTSAAAGLPKRIALVAPTLAGVLRNRANLIQALEARGHEVLAAAASHLAGEIAALHHLGAEYRNFDPQPPGMAMFAERRVVRSLRDILRAWQAEIVIADGRDLAALAAAAARKAGADRVVTIAGGLGLGSDAARARAAARFRRAVKHSNAVVCHNAGDARILRSVLNPGEQVAMVVTPGDGVDLEAFAVSPLPDPAAAIRFLMIADPEARGAIEAYAEAAREVVARGHAAQFHLATDREMGREAGFLTAEGVVFHGRAAQPAALLAAAHVAVHLSADDGSPVALMQALAAGRPILTLDVPGCREAVDERVNGCLVPPDDTAALVAGLESFIRYRHLLPSESRAARAKAEQAFDRRRVLAAVVAAVEG